MQTPIGEMWLDDDGILWHRIDAIVVSPEAARGVRAAVERLTGGRPAPSVIDMRAVGYADADARDVFASPTDQSFELATALIVDSSSSQAMARVFLGITRPQRPVKAFTSEQEAAEWARSFLEPPQGSRH
jgi:hypothetical protein